jgi:hypothetical protein
VRREGKIPKGGYQFLIDTQETTFLTRPQISDRSITILRGERWAIDHCPVKGGGNSVPGPGKLGFSRKDRRDGEDIVLRDDGGAAGGPGGRLQEYEPNRSLRGGNRRSIQLGRRSGSDHGDARTDLGTHLCSANWRHQRDNAEYHALGGNLCADRDRSALRSERVVNSRRGQTSSCSREAGLPSFAFTLRTRGQDRALPHDPF